MSKLYVSFGYQWNLRHSLMEFIDESEEKVREYMKYRYANEYAFIYAEEDAMRQVKEYNLAIVPKGSILEKHY